MSLRSTTVWWFVAFAALAFACRSQRVPRPTLLNTPPPLPPPEADEARLMPITLSPDAPEAPETAPGSSLESMARRALDSAQPEIVRCYETLLVRQPRASGRVEVQLDLGADGRVARQQIDHVGLDAMLPCLRDVFASVRVMEVSSHGRYVSRVYAFENHPIERVVHAAVVVTAPRATGRAARRRNTSTAQATTPSPAPSTPQAGPGALRADELTRALADAPALIACAPAALRRARRGDLTTTLRVSVSGDGAVSDVSIDAPATMARPAQGCVTDAVRALRFRASGIVVNARVPLTFRR